MGGLEHKQFKVVNERCEEGSIERQEDQKRWQKAVVCQWRFLVARGHVRPSVGPLVRWSIRPNEDLCVRLTEDLSAQTLEGARRIVDYSVLV